MLWLHCHRYFRTDDVQDLFGLPETSGCDMKWQTSSNKTRARLQMSKLPPSDLTLKWKLRSVDFVRQRCRLSLWLMLVKKKKMSSQHFPFPPNNRSQVSTCCNLWPLKSTETWGCSGNPSHSQKPFISQPLMRLEAWNKTKPSDFTAKKKKAQQHVSLQSIPAPSIINLKAWCRRGGSKNCCKTVLNIYDHRVAVSDQKRDRERLAVLQSPTRTDYHAAHVLTRKPAGRGIKVRPVYSWLWCII